MKDDLTGIEFHSGIFKAGTFIVSNHADELTPWTPILAALSNPIEPLPWLAIPCCSHALSGARHRYPISKPPSPLAKHGSTRVWTEQESSSSADTMVGEVRSSNSKSDGVDQSPASTGIPSKPIEERERLANGDLKALRAAKVKAANGADQSSMYACLTNKVIALAGELDIETESTLMRIPSTRNIGIVGGRRRAVQKLRSQMGTQDCEGEDQQATKLRNGTRALEGAGETSVSAPEDVMTLQDTQHEKGGGVWSEETILSKIEELLERECRASGGVAAAARIWIERAKSLQTGQGRGKLNAGSARG